MAAGDLDATVAGNGRKRIGCGGDNEAPSERAPTTAIARIRG
jgi:hypothetical protein